MANYFSHDYNARNDRKMVKLRIDHKMAGLGIYWSIIEMMYEEDGKLLLADVALIADELRTNTEIVESVIKDFGLFKLNKKHFWSESAVERLKKRGEKSKIAAQSAGNKWGSDPDNKLKRSQRLSAAREKGTHTKEEWNEMKEFFDNTCVNCNNESNLNGVVKDHIIPLYQGGSDHISNLQPLCARCNAKKGSDNTDLRISYCNNTGKMMPAKWLNNACEMPAIKEKKVNKKNIQKEKYLDHVELFPEEKEKLIKQYGDEGFSWMIQKLNNHKGSSGKKYKSDYMAILNWTVDAYQDFKRKNTIQSTHTQYLAAN